MSEQQIIVYGGQPLRGTITVSGSKNAALPIILASLLTENECCLEDVPRLLDVETASQLISSLGASVRWDGANTLVLKTKAIQNWEAPYEYVRKMRASVLTMGPLLARCGRAVVSLPGGCAIGSRPINLHLKGFEAMGAKVEMSGGLIKAKAKKLKGARIYLDFPSVGATENLIMAASLAEGQTIIENAAEEPEIVDLANFLNSMGAIIKGAGTPLIKIEGVAKLHGAIHTIIPDRIEAGSYMIAAALTRGNLIIKNCISEHLTPLIAKLKEMGVKVWEDDGQLRVTADSALKAIDIKTLPYPGFPTDLQAQLTTLCAVAQGTSVITETVFENRFMHVDELKRMGANIKIEGRSAIIQGVKGLSGALVRATDLRAGMALVMAGLAAEGETAITHVEHIDRGYEDLISKLQGAGACIQRKTSDHSEGFSGAGILQNMAAGPALG